MAYAASLDRKNKRVALIALLVALGMLGLGYAAVPLYRIFCQVTGFGGTTQRATRAIVRRTVENSRHGAALPGRRS